MVATGLVAGILALLAAGGASMNGRTINGETLDPRVTACGVVVEEGAIARLRPFIEASAELAGTFRLVVVKRSASGTSTSSQSNAFRAGTLGTFFVGIDRPSTARIELDVKANDGRPLCRLSRELKLGDETTEL